MKFITKLFLILVLLLGPVHSGHACWQFFLKLFGQNPSIELVQDGVLIKGELKIKTSDWEMWKKATKENHLYNLEYNYSNELLETTLMQISYLPPGTLETLSSLNFKSTKYEIEFLLELGRFLKKELGIWQDTWPESIATLLRNSKLTREEFYLNLKNDSNNLFLDQSKWNQVKQKFADRLLFHSVIKKWNSFNYKLELQIDNITGEKFLQIGEHKLKVKKNSRPGHYLVLVPVELVKHPYENPLSEKNLSQMSSSTTLRKPDYYDVTLGMDGNFYLVDGNHRFALFENKANHHVWVSLYDLKTTSAGAFAVLIGKTVELETKKKFFNNEITLKEIFKMNLIFPE